MVEIYSRYSVPLSAIENSVIVGANNKVPSHLTAAT